MDFSEGGRSSRPVTICPKKTKVQVMLMSLYERVETLDDWLENIHGSEINNRLGRHPCKPSYVKLLHTSLIGTPHQRPSPQHLSADHHSHQSEIVIRVIERLKKTQCGPNLLTIGFKPMSDDPGASISSSPTLEYAYPNSNVNQLMMPSWNTLLCRIGDQTMEHLLENHAVYLHVKGTCFTQLTGRPLYELFDRSASLRLHPEEQQHKNRARPGREAAKQWTRSGQPTADTPPGSSVQWTRSGQPTADTPPGSSVVCRKRNRPESQQQQHIDGWASELGDPSPVASPDIWRLGHKRVKAESGRALRVSTPPVTGQCGSSPALGSCPSVEPMDISDGPQVKPGLAHQPTAKYKLRTSTGYRRGLSVQERRTGLTAKKGRSKEPPGASGQQTGEETAQQSPFSVHHVLERKGVLCCRLLREGLPRSCKLVEASRATGAAQMLLDSVLGTVVGPEPHQGEDLGNTPVPQLQPEVSTTTNSLRDIMHSLIEKHRCCRYSQLLDHYSAVPGCQIQTGPASTYLSSSCSTRQAASVCTPHLAAPVISRGSPGCSIDFQRGAESQTKMRRNVGVDMTSAKLLEHHTSHRQVFLLLRCICLKVIPRELLGCAHNWKVFFKMVRHIVGLRRFEKVTVGQLMTGIKVKSVAWLRGAASNAVRLRLMAQVVVWLTRHLIFTVIKSYFYVTETGLFKNRMFYYRKRIWRRLQDKATAELLKKGTLRGIPEAEAKHMLERGESLGTAHLRFVPKLTSLRPIVNMSKSSIKKNKAGASINRQLYSVLQVLTYKKDQNPSLIGASTFGLDDTYKAWRDFSTRRRERSDFRPLYFVKVDLEGCFDSVLQQKLYQIIQNCFQESRQEFVVRSYSSVVDAGGLLKRRVHKNTCQLSDLQPDFVKFLHQHSHRKKPKNAIFVDQVLYNHEKSEHLLQRLRAHLFHNLIKIEKNYYLQVVGIAQGSILSTILCNYYYGNMEQQHLSVKEEEELLMRQVDDFLFITPHLDNAQAFLKVMSQGIPEYNCNINPGKTSLNFAHADFPHSSLPETALFPWCGLLINPATLEVLVDYNRYAGMPMKDTLTVELGKQPGKSLSRKMLASMRLRCHGILFDPVINCEQVVLENVYKLFLMLAFKFHASVQCLPRQQSILANPKFFHELVVGLPAMMCSVLASKMQKLPSLFLEPITTCVCLKAFLMVLQQHQGGYFPLLKALKHCLNATQLQLSKDRRWMMSNCVANSLPPDFKHIYH